MTPELKLINLLPATLDSREAATRLADIVGRYSGNKQIELDFSGIEFMSRSFADQFHKELYLRDEDSFEIVIKNADVSIIRYACYLIAQNADPSKEVVAVGQTYFAVQVRIQETGKGERN